MNNQLVALLKKDLKIDFRQQFAILGIFLFVATTVFIVFFSFKQINPREFVILYWIIFLFAAQNAILKSFVQESGKRHLYYYTLTDPITVLISKLIYNIILLLLIAFGTYALFQLLAGPEIIDPKLFVTAIVLGSLGIGSVFSFLSAIAIKAHNSSVLLTLLSFPIIIPVLMLCIKLSIMSVKLNEAMITPLPFEEYQSDLAMLGGIDVILLAMSLVLFSTIWKN